jgi:hypothetical protein
VLVALGTQYIQKARQGAVEAVGVGTCGIESSASDEGCGNLECTISG